MEIHQSTQKTEKNMDSLLFSVDTKMDKLVNHLIRKSDRTMIPASVLSWIVVALLVFNFAFVFGVPATERIAHSIGVLFGEQK